MKHLNVTRLAGLMFAGCLGMLQAQSAFAAAGDTIGNTATLNYSVGGTAQTGIESSPSGNSTPGLGLGTSTAFVEDRLLNVTVAANGGATVAPDGTGGVGFTVTNNGNSVIDILLSFEQGAADDEDFIPPVTYFLEEGTTPGYQAAEDTVSVTFLDDVAVGAAPIELYLVAQMPDDSLVTDGNTIDAILVAQVAEGGAAGAGAAIVTDDRTSADTAAVDDVFADTVAGPATVDGVLDGYHSALETFTIAAADLTVTKISSVLWDPINLNSNPKSIPGAYITYTITVANAGTAGASADLTTIVDALQAAGAGLGALDLDPDFVTIAGPGNPTSGTAGDSIQVDTTGTARPSQGLSYCTGSTGDADGCGYVGGPSGTITIDNAVLGALAVEAGYTAGELAPGDSVVYRFNAIVQ